MVQQAEGLGLTQITGDESMFLDTTGRGVGGSTDGPVPIVGTASSSSASSTATTSTSSTGPITVPRDRSRAVPGPFPYVFDMPFNVTLPNPVPATGVQFDATAPAVELGRVHRRWAGPSPSASTRST